jgi:predicted RNA-binding Zn-ribbon protein involved in translation (DUF1610 family)
MDQTFEEWYDKHEARYRNLAGVRHHLNNHYGKGEWGEDEFYQYMRELYDERKEKEAKELAESELKEFPIVAEGATVEERVGAYVEYFEGPSPNDLVMIRTMANLEIAIDHANQQYVTALSSDEANRRVAKDWSDILRNLSREHRQIQDTLGIGRAKREKEDRGADQVEYVRSVIRRAASFVKEHSIPIRCPHCGDEEAQVEINMGFILFHFRDDVFWQFKYQCPRCGEEVEIQAR